MAERDSIRIAVHNGTYHTDDVFALAISVLWAQHRGYDCTMVRTRTESELAECQVVLDVGGVYDPVHHRLDHHQSDFAEVRDNGIPYASAGLAWRHYGMLLCEENQRAWQIVDDTLIAGIDALDVGVTLTAATHVSGVRQASVGDLVGLSRPTWREEQLQPVTAMNQGFWDVYDYAKKTMRRAILHATDYIEAERKVVEAYDSAADKRIVVADFEYPAWVEVLSKYPEPIYFVYQRSDGSWGAKGVRVNGHTSFEIRKDFPTNWRGKKDAELQQVVGVSDARMVHRSGFMAVAESREGVLALVYQSLTE